jgi:prepilin-type N-terminal cleavage/methylation domain-containing protein
MSNVKRKEGGFTLLELLVVIMIVGILSALGFSQFVKMIEKSRVGEAKSILGHIRTSERAYFLENFGYTSEMDVIAIEAPTVCTSTHYFSYGITSAGANDFTAQAIRCTSTDGKFPTGTDAYTITVNADGTFGGSGGYY